MHYVVPSSGQCIGGLNDLDLTNNRQDMFCALVAGTSRILDFEFYPSKSMDSEWNQGQEIIPAGFVACQDILAEDILGLTAKVHALYVIRAKMFTSCPTSRVIDQADTFQASLESQAQKLLANTSDPVEISCILAIFLCIYGFWDGVWNASLLPRVISHRLLEELQRSAINFDWSSYSDLFTWMISIGLVFSVDEPIRQGFLRIQYNRQFEPIREILHSNEQQSILNNFIWSDVFYNKKNGSFWQHIKSSSI